MYLFKFCLMVVVAQKFTALGKSESKSQFTPHKLNQDRPKFANVNRPNPGSPWVRSSYGLEVGSTWGEPRLSAV